MMRIIAMIGVMALVACGAGPLPATSSPQHPAPDPRDLQLQVPNDGRDWFPSAADEPFPLDTAIHQDRIDDLRKLLEGGANPNQRWGDSGDRFPLQEALDFQGRYKVSDPVAVVKLLLEHGADPNAKWCPFETRGFPEHFATCTKARATTPLIFAAAVGNTEVVDLLLRAGADPTPRDWSNASALDYASDEVMFELISRALFPVLETRDRNALSWLKEYDGYLRSFPWDSTPLSRALFSGGSHYLGIAVPPPPGAPPIDYRADNDRRALSRVRHLIRLGADPNERAVRFGVDWTPVSMALRIGAWRSARVLLESGADPNQRSCAGFVFRELKPTERTVPRLDPACTLDNGITPLMWSAEAGTREAVELLLEFKADRSLKDWAGRTALDYAKTADIRQLLSVRP